PGSRPHAHRARTESTRRLRLRDPYLRRIESRAARGACGHVTLPDPVPALRARRRAHPRRACAVSRVPEPAGTCRCLTAEGGTLSAVGANSFARDRTSDAKGRMNSALQALSRIRLRSATLASINTLLPTAMKIPLRLSVLALTLALAACPQTPEPPKPRAAIAPTDAAPSSSAA